jgi:hypothetical protein
LRDKEEELNRLKKQVEASHQEVADKEKELDSLKKQVEATGQLLSEFVPDGEQELAMKWSDEERSPEVRPSASGLPDVRVAIALAGTLVGTVVFVVVAALRRRPARPRSRSAERSSIARQAPYNGLGNSLAASLQASYIQELVIHSEEELVSPSGASAV